MLKIDQILFENKMTRRELSRKSEIPYSCISDICNLKADIKNISFINAVKLSNALNIETNEVLTLQTQYDFESYRSDIQHEILRLGQLNFLLKTLKSNIIQDMYKYNLKMEALYLVSTIDYLSRMNNISLVNTYDKYRKLKCKNVIFPKDLLLGSENEKKKAIQDSIPEFIEHNIVEVDFLNVI